MPAGNWKPVDNLAASFGTDQQQALIHFTTYGRNVSRPNPIGYVCSQSAGLAVANDGLLVVRIG
ncbi:serralysin [Azospirillum oryzae]|uniref:Serralysin n=1 Tax=Azospirillum oryzae TaxID=286727 RepID=A0A1X7EZ35_9PROT|nr:hypothetical protein [Azospirillum oryzae]SMF42541.1 serralysin [Azospirillum oryzae]